MWAGVLSGEKAGGTDADEMRGELPKLWEMREIWRKAGQTAADAPGNRCMRSWMWRRQRKAGIGWTSGVCPGNGWDKAAGEVSFTLLKFDLDEHAPSTWNSLDKLAPAPGRGLLTAS
jgi:hypothetical protein